MPLVSEIVRIRQGSNIPGDATIALFDTSFYIALSQCAWWTYFVHDFLIKGDNLVMGLDYKVFEQYRAIYEEQRRDEYGNLLATLEPKVIEGASSGEIEAYKVYGWQINDIREKFSKTSKASHYFTPGQVDESLIETAIHRLELGSRVLVASADKDVCETLARYQGRYEGLEILSPYTLLPKLSESNLFHILLTGEAISEIEDSPEFPSKLYYLLVIRDVNFHGDTNIDLGVKVKKRGYGASFPETEEFYSAPIIKIDRFKERGVEKNQRRIANEVRDFQKQNTFVFGDTRKPSEFIIYTAKYEDNRKLLFPLNRRARFDLNWLKILRPSSFYKVLNVLDRNGIKVKEGEY